MARTSERNPYVGLVERACQAARAVAGVVDVRVRLERKTQTPGDGTIPRSPGNAPRSTPADGAVRPLALLEGDPLVLPADAPSTLIEALIRAAKSDRGTVYIRADGIEERQSYRELLEDAASVMDGLRATGLQVGDSVLLHCDDNRNFVTGFWAAVLGGFVPTPIATAPTYRAENAITRRVRAAWDLLDRPPLVTDRRMSGEVANLRRLWNTRELTILAVEDIRAPEPSVDLYQADPEDPVVHLLTSGSTGAPKCVRHVHRTVVTRAYANAVANGFGPEDVTLNFMPLDHVAGMVMHNVRDVVLQCEHVNARTDVFLADPLLWLTWIERHRVTNTSAPNFVITLMTKLADGIRRGRWDLSSLRDITNGGEAIVSRTTHDFLRLLAPHGLRPDVMRPAWGMSEMCGGVVHSTLRADDESLGVVTIDRWAADGTLTFLPSPRSGHPTFTAVGAPAPGASIRIVDSANAVLPEDHVGRLQVRGPTRMVGYYKNAEATASATSADGWFDTGDLGFVHERQLVMTGRDKDVLVIRSANYPCHEIESVVEKVEGVAPTFVAAGAEHDADTGSDELVLFCVFASSDPTQRLATVREIARRLGTEVGIAPRRVVPVPLEAFPKTSAGKIERQRLLDAYHGGAFDAEIAALTGNSDRPAFDADGLWLFSPVWTSVPSVPGAPPAGCWLIFDEGGLADRIRDDLPTAAVVVSVRRGRTWTKRSDVEYSIHPGEEQHYDELLAAVRNDHGDVTSVIHLWATSPVPRSSAAYADGLESSALSIHRLLKACGTSPPPRVLVLTTGACPISDLDPVEPLHATVNGLVRTANAEHGRTVVRQVDVRAGESNLAALALAELAEWSHEDIVAYRSGERFVRRIRPLGPSPAEPEHGIRSGGLYLVTGGLGRVGSWLCRLLLARYGAKLIVNGRSAPVGARAARLAELEALGDLTYLQADVVDTAALAHGIAAAEDRFGRILDGVFHLAGADIASNWDAMEAHLLVNEDSSEFQRMYQAKILGTLAIADVLEARPETLFVVASSVNGHFGGAAFGAYSSASSFLPAFVDHWRKRGRAGQCHAWSLWLDETLTAPGRLVVEQHGFRPVEPGYAGDLFEAALADPASHVLIGLDDSKPHIAREIDPAVVHDFDLVVEYNSADTVESTVVRDAVVAALAGEATVKRAEPVRTRREPPDRRSLPGRPPHGDVENAVANVWQRTLQQEAVGRDDNFFSLGGDSLTAMRVVARLNAQFESDLEVQDLYERPTVAQIAREIAARGAERRRSRTHPPVTMGRNADLR